MGSGEKSNMSIGMGSRGMDVVTYIIFWAGCSADSIFSIFSLIGKGDDKA